MASMLEVMREYKHLSAKKRAEGSLPPSLEERLAELEGVVRANVKKDDAPRPEMQSSPAASGGAQLPPPTARARPPVPSSAPKKVPTSPGSRLPAPATPAPQVARAPARDAVPSERARPADARPSGRTLEPPPAEEKPTLFGRIVALFPADPKKRGVVVLALVCGLLALDAGLAIALGVPPERATSSLIPVLLGIGGVGWALLYPGLVTWRERAAAGGSAHINEPDFEARVPSVEPVVFVLTVLGLVLWVWLGGHTTQGVGYLVGMLAGVALGLGGMMFGAIVVFRPIAKARVKKRALRQYLEGGLFHLNKGNPKRARRLLERALDEARGSPQWNEVTKHLKTATLQEAEELRRKGYVQKADELIRQQSSRPGMELTVGWGPAQVEDASFDAIAAAAELDDPSSANDVLAAPPRPPMLLEPAQILIDSPDRPRKPGPDEAAIRERARLLERRGRTREAFELFVQARVPVARSMAEDAAKDYIAQGMLRSADAIYQVLGQPQIPEFYKAVAAEWGKSGDPPPDVCVRLARTLHDLGESQVAARIACRGALSGSGDRAAKNEAAELALVLCHELGMEPPVELVESMGDFAAAAQAYEQEGRTDEALRAYRLAADASLARRDAPAVLIPLLSKIFLLDPNRDDKYLEPLAEHVLATNAAGPSSQKILIAYKKKKKDDDRLAARLFAIYLDGDQANEAYGELEVIAKAASSSPEPLLEQYKRFVDRFPEHVKGRGNYVRLLLKVGRIDEAAAEVRVLVPRAQIAGQTAEAIELIELLLDWGHSDRALRKAVGMMRLAAGEIDAGLEDLERYVREGGRDVDAVEAAKGLLSEDLATESGAPNHARLLRYGRFLLESGSPEASLQHLEVCRTSKEHKTEAEIQLARAYTALEQPKRAIALVQKAIAGRPLTETLELHFELARALEVYGSRTDAEKIDRAIKKVAPDFFAEYERSRPRHDQAETAWTPDGEAHAGGAITLETEPTDVNQATDATATPARARVSPVPEPRATPAVRGTSQSGASPRAGGLPAAARGASQTARPAVRGSPGATPGSSSPSAVSPSSPLLAKPEEEAPENLGETLLPRYRLLRKLGAGGMGEVHLAEDVDLGRYVAIKVLRRSLANDLFLLKFKEEARIVAQLAHPNIVSIFDLGQKGNYSYIVMEYVDGPDLATAVNKSGGFARARLIRIISTVADAMEYAHSRGVIHRDLKPANILVGPGDISKVTDFGIAKVLQPDGQETAFSAAGLQVGTVNYMAPEQIGGKAVDGRTDLYLLGTTLYVCLTGSFPYTGEAVVFQKLREDATPLRSHVASISTELEACVMRCLARRPDDRFQNMAEFSDALRRVPEARSK